MSIILKNINKTYNNMPIFKDFSFEFEEGNIYAITGTVGSGKTTLLNIISKITDIDSGSILGLENKKISYLFQDNRLLKNKNVTENLRFVLKDSMTKNESDTLIEKYLKLFGLYEYKDYNINKLSGGMQKKLAIARALLTPNFNVLILDEPFNNLDINQKNITMQDIIQTISNETIVIIVTHNIEDIQKFVDRVYVLNHKPNSKFEVKIID